MKPVCSLIENKNSPRNSEEAFVAQWHEMLERLHGISTVKQKEQREFLFLEALKPVVLSLSAYERTRGH